MRCHARRHDELPGTGLDSVVRYGLYASSRVCGVVPMRGLKIGQVAKRAGVGVETVRFYERKGLIQEPPRRASGYRQYPEDVIPRIRFIRRAGRLGFSLKEIQELLNLRGDSRARSGAVRDKTESKIREIEGRIADLESIKTVLAGLASRCAGSGPVGDCPILAALEMDGEA